MRLSYKWLSEYVDLSGITPQELADKMTTAGLEVEGLEPMAQATNLIIGEVVECEPIPETHLHATVVKTGNGAEDCYKIVCGAPNVRTGLKVVTALPGAVLPELTIQARKVRGYESNGMICSLLELGVDKKYLSEAQIAGIEELPADAPLGETNVLGYLGLDDTILDVSLTPNRADCSAMWDMAREVGAIMNRKVTWPDYEGKSEIGEKGSFRVASKTDKCPLFFGKVVNHVKIGPSPEWMKRYLNAAGMNSINNVVDISNYVMLETGQPLHFYNLAKLPAREITVVDDVETTITALDGVAFDIKPGDILITTGGEATGVAGIMGGEESMIDDTTEGIVIEAAHFDQASVRRSSIRLNLITEAAQRFTKGVEPLSCRKGMDRAVQLLMEYADASGFEATEIAGDETYEPVTVTETLTHCNALLGTSFAMEEVKEVLSRLNFEPEIKGDEIICHIPSYRTDIERPADIDEEVIRMIGFDSLSSTLPVMETTVGKLTPAQNLRRETRAFLMGLGLHEVVTYTLVGDEILSQAFLPAGRPVELAMPMSEARKAVRTSLLGSVLEIIRYNTAHSNTDAGYYEISKVYGEGCEQERLALFLDGSMRRDVLNHSEIKGDFYAMKGIIEAWLAKLGFSGGRVMIKANETDTVHFHPYRSAEVWVDRKLLGVFGDVHPDTLKQADLKQGVYAELMLDLLIGAKPTRVKFEALDRYPAVTRDIALVTAKTTPAQAILDVIRKTGKKLVKHAEVFDVYEGEHVGADQKSIALRITYQASDRTLTEEEVGKVHQAILDQLSSQLNAELRA